MRRSTPALLVAVVLAGCSPDPVALQVVGRLPEPERGDLLLEVIFENRTSAPIRFTWQSFTLYPDFGPVLLSREGTGYLENGCAHLEDPDGGYSLLPGQTSSRCAVVFWPWDLAPGAEPRTITFYSFPDQVGAAATIPIDALDGG